MPRRHENSDSPKSSRYKTKIGNETQMTSFRCNTYLRERLYSYAESVNKDPSYVIREAIAEFLRNKTAKPEILSQKEHVQTITIDEPKKPSAEDIWNNILKTT